METCSHFSVNRLVNHRRVYAGKITPYITHQHLTDQTVFINNKYTHATLIIVSIIIYTFIYRHESNFRDGGSHRRRKLVKSGRAKHSPPFLPSSLIPLLFNLLSAPFPPLPTPHFPIAPFSPLCTI